MTDLWSDEIRQARHLAQLADKDLNAADAVFASYTSQVILRKVPYVNLAIEHMERAIRILEDLRKELQKR